MPVHPVAVRADMPDVPLIAELLPTHPFSVVASVDALVAGKDTVLASLAATTLIPFPALLRDRLLDRIRIKEVAGRPRQQKDVFVGLGRTVTDALRQAVDLVPDDVAAQIPAVRTKGKRQHPRDADHVLRLDAVPDMRHLHRNAVRFHEVGQGY